MSVSHTGHFGSVNHAAFSEQVVLGGQLFFFNIQQNALRFGWNDDVGHVLGCLADTLGTILDGRGI